MLRHGKGPLAGLSDFANYHNDHVPVVPLVKTMRRGPVSRALASDTSQSWFAVVAQSCCAAVPQSCFTVAAHSYFRLDIIFPSKPQYFDCKAVAPLSTRLFIVTIRFSRSPLPPPGPTAYTPTLVLRFISTRNWRMYDLGWCAIKTDHFLVCVREVQYS